jgi:nicotinamide mononucleotide transporter
MDPIEAFAAAISLIAVVFAIVRLIWTFPIGIVGAGLYGWVFFDGALYANAALQLFFVVIQIYGWRHWHQVGAGAEGVAVRQLDLQGWIWMVAGVGAASGAVAVLMTAFTNAAAPVVDTAMSGLSVAAQILQARRYAENWPLWALVNGLGVYLFWSQGLKITAGLYALFLALALVGWWRWRAAQRG